MTPATDRRADARAEYTARLAARQDALARDDRLDLRLALARGGLLVLWLVLAALSLWQHALSAWWLLLPPAVFAVVAVAHAVVAERMRRTRGAIAFYEKGLARIDDRWIGTGVSTENFAGDSHLYATDLDLFGPGSLFELLCTARTRAGQETLARWLSGPAPRLEILARQEAVEELRNRLDLRDDLWMLASEKRPSGRLTAWATAPPIFRTTAIRWAALALSAMILTTLAVALGVNTNQSWLAFYGSLAVAVAFSFLLRERVHDVLEHAEAQRSELLSLYELFRRFEREHLRAGHFAALRSGLTDSGLPPFGRMAQIDRLLGFAELKKLDFPAALAVVLTWRVIVAPFSFLLWSTQIALAIETWRAKYGAAVPEWTRIAGELDALSAIAGYAYEHPDDPFPEIVDDGPVFDGDDLRHPLIPAARSVPNTIRLDAATPLLVVSGSNMSGKSTLLRTVGINAVLAFAGAPVRAARLRVSLLAIGATLRVHDSLQAGESRFYAEIQRIRRIVDDASGGTHVLFLFDELLHGTNSKDRAFAAGAILRALVRKGGIGLATTHDLALARIADTMSPRAANVHFQDDFKDGQMVFDYKMHPGVAQGSNALALMAVVGLPIDEEQSS
jgi:hypothetical protein